MLIFSWMINVHTHRRFFYVALWMTPNQILSPSPLFSVRKLTRLVNETTSGWQFQKIP
jgi:hypothetical protein